LTSARTFTLLPRFLALLLLGTLSACSFVAAPAPLPLEVPPSFSVPGGEPLPERWWTSLGDPDLDALADQALAGNFTLQQAWDRLDQARAAARKAGADLFPSLDAQGGYERTRRDTNGTVSYASSYSAGLVASYELDLWGRVRADRAAAHLEGRATEQDLAAAAITLSADLAMTWYRLVDQYGQQRLLEEQLSTNRDVLELLSLQFRTGRVGIADVLQQRQLVESTRGELNQVAASIAVLEHALAVLCGRAPGELTIPSRTELIELPGLPETGIPADLVERRPDVRGAFFRMRAADQHVAAAVAERFPRLALGGSAGSTAASSSALFDDWLASLAANLALPLIDGGARRAEVVRSRAVAAEALHGYGQTVLEAFAEVEDALAREQQQRAYLASLERQLELAAQAIERIRDRYLQGVENYQRVLAALISYQNLQRRLLTGQRELVEYRIALCRALAGGWRLERGSMAHTAMEK